MSGGGPYPVALLSVALALAALAERRVYLEHRSQDRFTQCKTNLKNIGTACEMYSTDFAGRYPPRLSLLVPNYLMSLPTCPEAGRDTYSESFQSASNPDCYTFYCAGDNHVWAEDEAPRGFSNVRY